MFTRGSVEAFIGQYEALHRFATNNVGLDDFIDIGFLYVSIPDGLRINDEIRPMLALIETSSLVGSHFAFEPAFRQFLLE